jgi:benzoyl-CoA reductase subunit C
MEAKLKELIDANKPENRNRWALEWKQQGKKVIGTLCTYLPEEVIYAADMLPWRITGSWESDVYLGTAYRPPNTCPYCTHVLQSFLAGEFPFLDGVVAANRDFDTVRLYDVLVHLGTIHFTHIVDVPHHNSELAYHQFGKQIWKLMDALEAFGGIKITNDALHHAINIYNHQRVLLRKVYELRKKEVPP